MWSIKVAPRSLYQRLSLALIAGTTAVLVVSFFMLHLAIRAEFYAHIDSELLLRMRAVAAYAAEHPGAESVAEFMPRFRTSAHRDYFQVWDGQGRTLARSDSSIGRDLPRYAAGPGRVTYRDLVLPDGHRGRAIAESFPLTAGDPRGTLVVTTAEEVENIESLERRLHAYLLLIAVATVAAMLLITRYAVRRGLKPVDEFARSLAAFEPDAPQPRPDSALLPTELRPVAASFSGLMDRLLDALAREKRFARNAAHELRNPLAEIRLLAEVGGTRESPKELREAIGEIGASATELERVVEALLALTRYEAGLVTPQPEPVELCGELRRQVATLESTARRRSIEFAFDLPREHWIYTDSALLRRLFANLLGNAVAHAPEGSSVKVELRDESTLRIANAAPCLSASDLPKLGERFYRVDTGGAGQHTGLGLSLARAMAKVLDLRLQMTLEVPGTLVASLDGFRGLAAGAQ